MFSPSYKMLKIDLYERRSGRYKAFLEAPHGKLSEFRGWCQNTFAPYHRFCACSEILRRERCAHQSMTMHSASWKNEDFQYTTALPNANGGYIRRKILKQGGVYDQYTEISFISTRPLEDVILITNSFVSYRLLKSGFWSAKGSTKQHIFLFPMQHPWYKG